MLGSGSANAITFNGSVASSIPISANTSWDFGSATLGLKSVYLGGSGSFTVRIISPTLGASYTLTLPAAVPAVASLVQSDTSANLSFYDKTLIPPVQNYLINGAFDFWQRGTSTTIANGSSAYQADRWYAKNSLGTNGIITYSQVAGVTNGSKWGASVKISTAPTAAQANGCELYQTLENRDALLFYGQNGSFTVQVKGLGNVTQVGVQFFYNTTEAKVASTIGSEVLTTVNSSTFTACTINGQAIGTSMTTSGVVGVRIRITGVSSGNAYDLNNGFVCEQAVMSVGTTAGSFSRAGGTYQGEFVLCQRYCYLFSGGTNAPVSSGQCISSTQAECPILFPQPMRATPTIVVGTVAAWAVTNSAGSLQTPSTITLDTSDQGPFGFWLTVVMGSGVLSAGNATQLILGSGSLLIDADI